MDVNDISPYLKTALLTYFPWFDDPERFTFANRLMNHDREFLILDTQTKILYKYVKSAWGQNSLEAFDSTHSSYEAFMSYFNTEKEN